jgi:hypothetical protein
MSQEEYAKSFLNPHGSVNKPHRVEHVKVNTEGLPWPVVLITLVTFVSLLVALLMVK